MAKFTINRKVSIRWNGFRFEGPALTVFEVPDEYYDEIDDEIRSNEPTFQWVDQDEGATLRARVTALENGGGNGGAPLSNDAALSLGTAAAGTGTEASRDDHVHPTTGLALSGHNHSGVYEPVNTAILKSVVDAKGDLIVGTAADTVDRLPGSGTNGYVLTYDSAETTGLKWAAAPGSVGGAPVGTATPLALGTASAGDDTTASREDHVHPTTGLALSGHNHDASYAPIGDANRADIVFETCKNSSGATIAKGKVVYINGSDGTNPTIALSDADTEATSSKTLGFTETSSGNGDQVNVITHGRLTNVDTSAASTEGVSVWLSGTAGDVVFGSPPAEPAHAVYLGVVTKKNVSTGEIFVKVQNGYELDELHDVSAASPSNGDVLQYNSTTGMWNAAQISAGSGDITEVVAGAGLTGGATSGSASLAVGAGTGITVNADDVAVDTSVVTTLTGTQTLTNKTLTLPSVNNVRGNYTTTVASATAITLTSSSTYYQYITGSTGQTVNLPDTSTLSTGHSFEIHNNSTSTVTVRTSTAATIGSNITNGLSVRYTCISTADNTAASWDAETIGSTGFTGSGNSVFSSSPTLSGATLTGAVTLANAAIRVPYTAIVSAGTTTNLSSSVNIVLEITGTSNHTVQTPASNSTGQLYIVRNASTGTVTVQTSAPETLATLSTGQAVLLQSKATNATTAANWLVNYLGGATATGTGSSVFSASPTFTGTITTPLTTAGVVKTNASGVLSSVATLANSDLTNSSITINGTAVSLGGSTTVSGSQSLTQNQQTGTTYTLAASDLNKLVELNNAAAITVTVPANILAAGDQIHIMQTGAGQVTVAAGANVSAVNSALGLKLRTQWSSATLIKRVTSNNADVWVLVGDTTT